MNSALHRGMLYHRLMSLEFIHFHHHAGDFVYFILYDLGRQEKFLSFYEILLYLGKQNLSGPDIHWLLRNSENATVKSPVSFEEVLENSSQDIQEKLLFNLDIFR